MGLARSSFYYQPKGKSFQQMVVEADVRDRIEAICLEFPRYGYRRVTQQLRQEGWSVNHKKLSVIAILYDAQCPGDLFVVLSRWYSDH